MDAKTDAYLRKMKAEIRANYEKSEVIQSTLVSWMDTHQARTQIPHHTNMADHTVGNADDSPVFINNSSEASEATCACCDKFETELQKTLTEFRSAQKLELLQEEIYLNIPNRTVSTDE
jgi:hypothetical protein